MARQCERPGGCCHLISGINVCFQDHRDAVHGTTRTADPPFLIESFRDLHRFRVYLNNRVQLRSAAINRLDPLQVVPGKLCGAELTLTHQSLQCGDIVLFVLALTRNRCPGRQQQKRDDPSRSIFHSKDPIIRLSRRLARANRRRSSSTSPSSLRSVSSSMANNAVRHWSPTESPTPFK